MQVNDFKEDILENINKEQFNQFAKDLDRESLKQEQLSEEEILKMEDRFTNMSEEDILKELQDMFIMKRKPYTRKVPKLERNKPCPCGSGKKYKKCCKDQFENYLESRRENIGDI